ncbi:MAG: TlpA disulfide reductase family protein [Bacteroidota bacterium]
MKHSLILVLVISLWGMGCQPDPQFVILEGELPDLKNEKLVFATMSDFFPGLGSTAPLAETRTDSNGYFYFKVPLDAAQYVQVTQSDYGRLKYDLLLEPGDSIYVKQSSWKDEPDLRFSGRGAAKLSHLEADYQLFPKDKPFYDKLKSKDFPTAADFLRFMDSLKILRLEALAANDTLSPDQRAHFEEDIHFEHADFLLAHLERRNYYMERKFEYYYPDSIYLSFLNEIDFESSSYESSLAKKFAGSYLTYKARLAFQEEPSDDWWKKHLFWKFDYVYGLPANPWKDQLALSTVTAYSEGLLLDSFFQEFTYFQEAMTFSEPASQGLFDSLSQDYQQLAPGMMAPDFTLPNAAGELVSLSDFKGKVVYLDFWGTWCYPCIQEIPNTLKLKDKFKDENVVFLYVALEYNEKNIANWKQFIQGKDENFGEFLDHKPFPGVHLVAEKQFRNEAIQPYKINFAPTFVLIDQEGRIQKARADRPKEISEEIQALLDKEKQDQSLVIKDNRY